MKVGLYDCDFKKQGNKFPNLALMKISTYHKAVGDCVETVEGADMTKYDRIYMSKVFTFTPDPSSTMLFLNFKGELIKGGTGFDVKGKLPPEIECQFPDYSIYPSCNYAIGFLSRGCPNQCSFCCVHEKEGKIQFNQTWQEIKRQDSNKIIFMDNNVLACDEALENLKTLIGERIYIDFNQGLDAILFNEQHAELLSQLNLRCLEGRSGNMSKGIRFSCDKKAQLPHIARAIKLMGQFGYKPRDFNVYAILIDYEDSVYRLNYLHDLGVRVNAQPFRDLKKEDCKIPQWQKEMSNWTFKKSVWAEVEKWEEYGKSKNLPEAEGVCINTIY